MKVADYIEPNLEALISRFVDAAGKLESARALGRTELIDTFPEYLKTLARHSRLGARPDPLATRERLAHTHVNLRLRQGYTQQEVTSEYVLLGQLITSLWHGRPEEEIPGHGDVRLLFDELQDAMETVTALFTGYSVEDWQAEKRTLRRLMAAAPESMGPDLGPDALAQRLSPLTDIVREALGVDVAALLLVARNGTDLVMGACSGAPAELLAPLAGRLGDNTFCTQVVASEEPLFVPDTETGSLPVDPAIRGSGLRTLLGLRMWQRQLIGLLYVGVKDPRPFTPRERRYFETLVEAIGGIVQRALLLEDARTAHEHLKQQAEFERQLIGIVSHDLRNPLQAITIGAQSLLRREGLGDAETATVARILRSTERANRMIRDLLDFTQARLGGGLPLKLDAVDLGNVARGLAEEVQLANPDREIEVQVEGDTSGRWDADRIGQVLTNLLTNALNYSTRHSPVRLRVSGEPREVSLSVHNVGPAIPPETRRNLFKPLERGTAAVDHSARSVGLGLFIVSEVVRAHHGTVEVESTEQAGTTFTVRLPRASG